MGLAMEATGMSDRSYRAKGHAHRSPKDYDRKAGKRELRQCQTCDGSGWIPYDTGNPEDYAEARCPECNKPDER